MRVARPAIVLVMALPCLAADMPAPATGEICGDCHRAIHSGWKQSGHATAMESRFFQDALKLAEADYGEQGRKLCLSCHSPVGVQLGDLGLVRKVSWEGVTCDYCHSIRQVTAADGNFKARVEFTGAKSGPSKDSVSPAHASVFSEVHTTSLACAVCHDYVNGAGFPVLTTYSEWKASSYGKQGQHCQWCHMSLVEGDVVDPRVKRDAAESVNLHQMPGSHSVDQLTKAVKLQMSSTHEGDRLDVTVKITNTGAGHHVPTGSPLRRLILEVRANPYGGQRYREERVFTRAVADKDGKPIRQEHVAFVKAAQEISDTRIAAGATWSEVFSFDVPNGIQSRVEASLYYYYSPSAQTDAEERIKFLNMSRLVP